MRLNDTLVNEFTFNDVTYPIDLSFDNVLDVFDVLNDPILNDYDKLETFMFLLIGDIAVGMGYGELIVLSRHIFNTFISPENVEELEFDLIGNPLPKKVEAKTIDLKKDAKYIYASFLQAYNINLFKSQGKLHWFEFKALLSALPENTVMQSIINIRTWKPRKGESAEYRAEMRKLKKKYTLEDDDEEVGDYG